ncbi:glycosyltransferase [bacterium]|nr:glycosyltransferase [bacterium]MDB4793030.1 glycosyltransferase [bacterium]
MPELEIICCHYNPCNYRNLRNNYWKFRESLNADLTTVELSFNGQFEIPDAVQISGNDFNVMWQKERLLNIAIESSNADYIAWVDADLIFQNPNWINETLQKLEHHPVVQLFESVTDLDATGHVVRTSVGDAYGHSIGLKGWKRPGGAWAARCEVLQHGLADAHILGSGDAMLLSAWRGRWRHPLMRRLNKGWKEHHLRYAAKVYPLVTNNISHVSGDCLHLHHGSKENRNYVGRTTYLTDHDFDPNVDICIDEHGLWKWNSDKPEMHQQVKDYFSERREDE